METENQKPDINFICRNCKALVSPDDAFCIQCGFPLKGSQSEQGKFIGKELVKKGELEEAQRKVKQACNTLFVMVGLMVLSGLVLYGMTEEVIYILTMLIFALIYLGLGFWAKIKPFAAIFTGCLLYLTLLILDALADPNTIYRGIVVKIIIISFLVRGTISAWKAKEMLK